MTPAEYLARERTAATRTEYYGGVSFAKGNEADVHATIMSNLTRVLRLALSGSQGRAVTLPVRVATGACVHPDLALCDDPQVDDEANALCNPSTVIEVVSPSTELFDRGAKSAQYRAMSWLKEYVLVSQSEPRVEVYRRLATGEWLLSEAVGLEAVIHFVGPKEEPVRVYLCEIYERVEFGTANFISPSERTAS